MAVEVLMPKLGLTMTEGMIGEWKKKIGDTVKKGELLFSVETDKLTNDIEADADGILLQILCPEGESAECKSVIAYIGSEGEIVNKKEEDKIPSCVNAGMGAAPVGKRKVAVIGGGPGGYVAAIRAAQLGADVTVIEKAELGGTCLNVGCIPTKCLVHSAELLAEVKSHGSENGLLVKDIEVDFPRVMENKRNVSMKLRNGVAGLLKLNGVTVIRGEASFVSPERLNIAQPNGDTKYLDADAVIVAVGSVGARPPIPGMWENPSCIDSTGALELETIPGSMVIVGGGVIGTEMACTYATFGTKITVIEALDSILPMLDSDIRAAGAHHMEKMGIKLLTGTRVESVESCPMGARINCRLQSGELQSFEAEKVLVAIGRRANTDKLNLEAAGIQSDRGRILVDDSMRTNVPNVYAIGDCVFGHVQLAHAASAMGEVAAENCMGYNSTYDEKTCPSCVYMMPEVASVGLTEVQAKEKNIACKVGMFPLSANGKSLIMNGGEGFVKIIADEKYGEVLGVHIIGARATDLIAEGALALRLECTLEELIDTIHAHPTVSEAVREAALHAKKRAIHTKN